MDTTPLRFVSTRSACSILLFFNFLPYASGAMGGDGGMDSIRLCLVATRSACLMFCFVYVLVFCSQSNKKGGGGGAWNERRFVWSPRDFVFHLFVLGFQNHGRPGGMDSEPLYVVFPRSTCFMFVCILRLLSFVPKAMGGEAGKKSTPFCLVAPRSACSMLVSLHILVLCFPGDGRGGGGMDTIPLRLVATRTGCFVLFPKRLEGGAWI